MNINIQKDFNLIRDKRHQVQDFTTQMLVKTTFKRGQVIRIKGIKDDNQKKCFNQFDRNNKTMIFD